MQNVALHKEQETKSPVRTIELDRVEGVRAQWKATTFGGANRVLSDWAQTVNAGPGYDKVLVKITWANGCVYQYRLDLKHPSQADRPNLESDVAHAIAFSLGRAPNPTWSEARYAHILERYRAQGIVALMEKIDRTCAIGDLPEDAVIELPREAQLAQSDNRSLLERISDAAAVCNERQRQLLLDSFNELQRLYRLVDNKVVPRVLVTVSGGVADYVADPGVDVEVFDHDNYHADPKNTASVPAHFRDLAAPNVPCVN